MAKICCVIGPDAEALMSKLGSFTGPYNWVQFDCDVRTEVGFRQAIKFLDNLRPAYLMVGLADFDQDDCALEKAFSRYLFERQIPTHFMLPEEWRTHNIEAMNLSLKTGIRDFSGNQLVGETLLSTVQAHIAICTPQKYDMETASTMVH